MLDFNDLLKFAVESGGSDLHLKVGSSPYVRIDGRLVPAPFGVITSELAEAIVQKILPAARVEEFRATNEADFGLSAGALGRFRVNVMRQRGNVGLTLRRVPTDIPSITSLALPASVQRLSDEPRGLVLVTGPTGSGKTTTIAAMLDHINETKPVNIVTIEDPIEVLHTDKRAIVSQREIGIDTLDYPSAMKHVLRQDPDIIFIGEMRDPDTVSAALAAAETGHLVVSTLHTINAAETVNRIIDFFPAYQQRQVRLSLAASLCGIVSQRLLPKVGGLGRVAAVEVLVMTGRVFERMVDSESGDEIEEIIAEGDFYGMQTFDQALLALCKQGTVEMRDAIAVASHPHDLRIALQSAGLLSTSSA